MRARAQRGRGAEHGAHAARRSSGVPLSAETREQVEPLFSFNFADVRVHADDEADASARELGAIAFTQGRDVYFRGGEYKPSTIGGRWLIAHELAHVVQQSGASHGERGGESRRSHLEGQADRAANHVLSGRAFPVSAEAGAPAMQRAPDDSALRRRLAQLDALIEKEWTTVAGQKARTPAADWPGVRPGAEKTVRNLLEERFVVALRLDFPDLTFVEQVHLTGVVVGDTFYPAAEERIADWAQLKDNQVMLGDLKTERAIEKSVKGGVKRGPVEGELKTTKPGSTASKTKMGDQIAKEKDIIQAAKDLGGKIRIRAYDSTTGSSVEVLVDPGNVELSRINTYTQRPDKLLGEANPTPRPTAPVPAPPTPPAGEDGGSTPAAAAPTTGEPTTPEATTEQTPAKQEQAAPAAQTEAKANEPTARVGMPDVDDVHVGGPSAQGEALGGGVVVGAQLKDWLMEKLVERTQGKLLDEKFKRRLDYIQSQQAAHPELGAFVTIYWHAVHGNEGESTRRFDDISVKLGTTEQEARQSPEPSYLDLSSSSDADREIDQRWFPPLKPLPLAEMPTPHAKIAIATFAFDHAEVQGAEWSGIRGFRKHGRRSASFDIPKGKTPEFAVLMPPASIIFWDGRTRHTADIDIARASTANGFSIPVLDKLDAAMVFPLDNDAAMLLGKGGDVYDLGGQLNDDYVFTRFVPAKDIRIVTVLTTDVAPVPPTAEEKLQRHIDALPINVRELLVRMQSGSGKGLKITEDMVDRFERIVPLDLSADELGTLVGRLGPIGERSMDIFFDDLAKSVAALPGRSGQEKAPVAPSKTAQPTAASTQPETSGGASPDAVQALKRAVTGFDWSQLPHPGIYFGGPKLLGMPENSVVTMLAYNLKGTKSRSAASVTVRVGKRKGTDTQVTVISSTDWVTASGAAAGSGFSAGSTFPVGAPL